MGMVNTDKVFDAEEIRDTSVHNGIILNMFDYRLKTIIIENGLNEIVTLYCEGSAHEDFSKSFIIGGIDFDVAATTDTYQTCDSYFPYMRMVAQCDNAPTSGSLSVYFVQYGGA